MRVTLGINKNQRHSFECQGCGEEAAIELEVDFENREQLGIAGMSSPSIASAKLVNAEWTELEGTITNLDPTFLVPEDILHVDGVFPWMYHIKDIVKPIADESPRYVDVIDQAGMSRGIREGISAVLKAFELASRGRHDLVTAKLAELSEIVGTQVRNLPYALLMVASAIVGKNASTDVHDAVQAADRAFERNPVEYGKLRRAIPGEIAPDFLERQLGVLKDYLRGYDQFNQAWYFAANNIVIDEQLQPSARGLDTVKHFYGTAFEHLSSGLVVAACVNNVLSGRPYDQFASMDLKRYLTIDKAGRARCIEERREFTPLWSEFDSTLRNGSYHQGLRLKPGSRFVIQYRTGDTKAWQDVSYSSYLVRCNKIMICLMKLLMFQCAVFGPGAFEPN